MRYGSLFCIKREPGSLIQFRLRFIPFKTYMVLILSGISQTIKGGFITFKTYMVLKQSFRIPSGVRCFITFKTYMVLKQ